MEIRKVKDMGWMPSFKECGMAPFDYYPSSANAYPQYTYPLMMTGISLEDKEDMPEARAIYFAVSKKTGLLYIGRAKNLHSRWQNHHRIAQLKRYGDVCISWITFANLETEHLHDLEAAYIGHFLPPLNQTHDNKIEQTYARYRVQFEIPEEAIPEEVDPNKVSLSIEVLRDSDFAKYLMKKYKETGIKPRDQIGLYARAHVDMIRGQNR